MLDTIEKISVHPPSPRAAHESLRLPPHGAPTPSAVEARAGGNLFTADDIGAGCLLGSVAALAIFHLTLVMVLAVAVFAAIACTAFYVEARR
jgi:hypothetical protein